MAELSLVRVRHPDIGTGLHCMGLACDGLASHPGGVDDFHLLYTMKTVNKHRPYTSALSEIHVTRA